ncbi:MAG: UvrD-helicase domain-containing protein, partial [Solirubrobacteraceae bacterium]
AAGSAAAELAAAGTGKLVGRALEEVQRCADLLSGQPGAPSAALLGKLSFGAGANALKSEACARYLAALEAYAVACRDRDAAAAVALLDELLGAYADRYAAAKRDRAAVDFDDLELFARDLLSSEPALRRSYAERFERVMVDEFQDSSPRQLALFEALDRDDLFVVGDEQQSIYGFRHADVDVFRSRRDALRAGGQVATLATNFRGRGQILQTINAAFAPRLGADFVALREGRAAAPAPQEPLVELLLTDQDGWETDGAGEQIDLGELPQAKAWRHAEARLLAQRVCELVDAGQARPEQIVVLLRALGDLPTFERALEDQGLLTLSVGGRGYWGRQVVRDLCAWLAALANPRDETALYGVLASPLVGVSSDALAQIAQAGRGHAWRAIEGAADGLSQRLRDDDRARLDAFAARFGAERELAPRLGLDELLRRVVDQTGYDLHVLSLAGGAGRLANVHKLQRLAAAFEREHGRDVRGLADLATAELEAEARESDAPVELGDARAVRLMSIHAAKGLEFHTVCVADLGRGRRGDEGDLLVDGDDVGLRLVGLDGSSDKALAYERLRERAQQRSAREEDRVLYVAATRACERLILSGGVRLARWPKDEADAPPLSWLVPALLDGDLTRLPSEAEAVRDIEWAGAHAARLRCSLNAPATIGRVLRARSLAPAGAKLPVAAAQPQLPPVPQAGGTPPVVRSLSYSSLAAWRRCGYRFYLTRVLGLREEEPARGAAPGANDSAAPARAAEGGATPQQSQDGEPGLDPRLRGTLVHALLERPGAAAPRVAEIAARHGATLTDADAADVARLADGFARSPLAARLARARSVRREHVFAVPLGATLLTGIVDVLAVERGGRRLVIDYKTDALRHGDDLGEIVDRDYAVQRRVYALAALRGGAVSVEIAHAFLERPSEPVLARFEAADGVRLEAELLALADGMLAGRYPVTDHPHLELCDGCPGRRALCSHPPELTLRADRAI